MKTRIKPLGFTLIEIMIALTIFSIIAVIMTSVLFTVFHTRDRLLSHQETTANWQSTILLMQREISQIVPLFPIEHPASTHMNPSLKGNAHEMKFTCAGFINPGEQFPRSHLQEVEYSFVSNSLQRKSHTSLKNELHEENVTQILLTHLRDFEIAYITPNQIVHEWPSAQDNTNSRLQQLTLPIAIQIKGVTEEGKTFFYYMPLASQSPIR